MHQEDVPLGHVLNRHLISICWLGTWGEEWRTGYQGNVTSQHWQQTDWQLTGWRTVTSPTVWTLHWCCRPAAGTSLHDDRPPLPLSAWTPAQTAHRYTQYYYSTTVLQSTNTCTCKLGSSGTCTPFGLFSPGSVPPGWWRSCTAHQLMWGRFPSERSCRLGCEHLQDRGRGCRSTWGRDWSKEEHKDSLQFN